MKVWRWIKNIFKGSSYESVENSPAQKLSELEIIGHVKSIIAEEWIDLIGLMRVNSSPEYWIRFITALSYVECGYNASLVYPEGAPLYYDSVGLLQLSEPDFKSYGYSPVNLKDPYENLKFGIFILNRIAYARKKVIFDDDNYWSTLRPNRNSKQYLKFVDKMSKIIL